MTRSLQTQRRPAKKKQTERGYQLPKEGKRREKKGRRKRISDFSPCKCERSEERENIFVPGCRDDAVKNDAERTDYTSSVNLLPLLPSKLDSVAGVTLLLAVPGGLNGEFG